MPPVTTSSTAPGPAALQPGFVLLDRFRLEHAVGPGDLGEQWRALDQTQDRAVLVEVLPPGPPLAPQEVKALQELAGRLTGLDHPGIARVLQLGFLGAQPVVAREWIPGLSLADRTERTGPVPVAAARAWLEPVAAALDAAHARGLVHGHLGAAAVRFRADGGPVLVGLELSPFHPAPPGAPRSPEQRLGRPATKASDVYALTALAAELVGTADEALAARLRQAMADEPARRPPRAREVVALLEATPPVPAGPPMAGVAAVLAGLGVLGGLAALLLAPASPAPEATPAPALPAEAPYHLELGAGAPPLADPRDAVGRFTARALGRTTRGHAGFVLDLGGKAGVVVTARQIFGPAGDLPRPLADGELRGVAGARLELGTASVLLGRRLDLAGSAPVVNFTRPARDAVAFLVDRPRAGLVLREERLVRDEPLVVLTWTGELYRAEAEAQVTGARTYRFLGAVPPPSAVGAPVLDRKKRVVGIHAGTFPRVRGVGGICTASDQLRDMLMRALAPLFARARAGG